MRSKNAVISLIFCMCSAYIFIHTLLRIARLHLACI